MDVNELKADAAAGKLSVERLLAVIVTLQQRIAELEAQLKDKNPTERLDEPYSEKAEDKRKKRRPSKKPPLRRGRVTMADKIKLAGIVTGQSLCGALVLSAIETAQVSG